MLAGVATAGIWLLVPRAALWGLALLYLIATVVAVARYRRQEQPEAKPAEWPGRKLALALAAFGVWAAAPAVAGWQRPPNSFDLAFPFTSGRYLVANGGSTERINGHFMTLDPRFAKWRGESYAVDLIKVDEWGFRTRRKEIFLRRKEPAAYLTFGTPVAAPCNGHVEASEHGRADMPVPLRDREHLEGNFVRLRCGQYVVLLAHFRFGGVNVAAGQKVRAGQIVGHAGNSGNSDEPHLHIHVQSPGSIAEPLSGAPVPLTFRGQFLVRNMIVDAQRFR